MVTTAKSTIQAIQVVEQLGGLVTHVSCLVDRQEGGAEALSKYKFLPIFKRSEIE